MPNPTTPDAAAAKQAAPAKRFQVRFRHRGADGLPDDELEIIPSRSLNAAKQWAKSIAAERDWRLVSVEVVQ